jgi:hypothetical protein
MRIPEILRELPAMKQKNQQIVDELVASNAEIEAITKELQELCSHPTEYLEPWGENVEAIEDEYRCTACGKIISEDQL